MAKKERREVPENELTEEEVRRWFNRLRELYKESTHRIHEMKVERWKMRVEMENLKTENIHLMKRIKHLEMAKEKKVEKKDTPVNDFKKKFLDSL